jgi:tripartite-type tricarboxylate transporter receptor subunit TctC
MCTFCFPFRFVLAGGVALAAGIALTGINAQAAEYPLKPVRIIVPSVAGAGLDSLARLIAQKLTERTGKAFVIDNRAGGSGAIGLELGARAVADGYTLVMFSATHVAANAIPGKQSVDFLKEFAPVIWATNQPYVLNVNSAVSAKSVAELIALAKAKPGAINYGSSGTGSIQHLAGVSLSTLSGAKFFHVPYKGGAQVVNDLLGGQIQMSFTIYPVCKPHIESGRLRALGVTTAKRSPALPNIPAISEAVPHFDMSNWYGMVATAGTPEPILDWLYREISGVLQQRDIKRTLAADTTEVSVASRQEFDRHLARETVKWSDVIRQSGISIQ